MRCWLRGVKCWGGWPRKARSIQRNFLPTKPATADRLDVYGHSVSCDETGGDYYDYFEMPGGALGLVIADVTGHGVGPAGASRRSGRARGA